MGAKAELINKIILEDDEEVLELLLTFTKNLISNREERADDRRNT